MAVNVQKSHEMPALIDTQPRKLRTQLLGAMMLREPGEPAPKRLHFRRSVEQAKTSAFFIRQRSDVVPTISPTAINPNAIDAAIAMTSSVHMGVTGAILPKLDSVLILAGLH
jgi:hypothetical protein